MSFSVALLLYFLKNNSTMKIKSSKFLRSSKGLEDCPVWDYSEIAFIGRSNVGKSSLINLLSSKKDLAKVSATPGKTQLVNFFLMNEKWCLVDLPGYGYAKIAQNKKDEFQRHVSDYILERVNLRHVFLLIDSRHEPQKIDVAFAQWLSDSDVPYSVVMTKIDKHSAAKSQANAELFLNAIAQEEAQVPHVYFVSSAKKIGTNHVLNAIDELLKSI